MNRLFPFLAVASLGAPFVLGWAMSGTLAGAARHGALRHQIDPSAMLIRAFERLGWATGVRWPTAGQSG